MFVSAKDSKLRVDALRAILDGKAKDGGLYVPEKFPKLTWDLLQSLTDSSLAERMARVLSLFVDLERGKLIELCKDAASAFEDELPLTAVEEGLYMLDLTGGGSARADDISIRVFARLVSAARAKFSDSRIRVATFAGSAACGKTFLDAFKGVEGVAAIAFVPDDENILSVRGLNASATESNVQAVGVKGEKLADELQKIMSEDKIADSFASFNCMPLVSDGANIGRVLPYIACFVSAYVDLVSAGRLQMGDKLNFALPAGDLCAAIAGVYAKQIGLPIDRLILAFNANRGVMDLISEGNFKTPNKIFATCAPEMDVALPANLERLAFELADRNSARTAEAMYELKRDGAFALGDVTDSVAYDLLVAGWADEDDIKETANNFFDIDDAVLDPHAAATASVLDDYCNEAADDTTAVIMQTVDPYVYATNTLKTLGVHETDALKAVSKLELLTALERPRCIDEALATREAEHDWLILTSWMEESIVAFIKRLA